MEERIRGFRKKRNIDRRGGKNPKAKTRKLYEEPDLIDLGFGNEENEKEENTRNEKRKENEKLAPASNKKQKLDIRNYFSNKSTQGTKVSIDGQGS